MDCMRDGFEHGKLLGGRFLTIAPLNHGSFGMVFSAKDTVTGIDVAVKCITKADAVKDHTSRPIINIDERSEELAVHSRLNSHPNIVNLVHNFDSAAHQYMVLELCSNGDLYEAIRVGRGPLETEHVRSFMLQLVGAIEHLHANGVFHRDIKPENIFLTSSGDMKLGDFGLATTDTWSTEFAVGSDRYMAPEQFDASVYGYGYSPASADVWAIGIVLLNVLFQRNPFASPTMKDPLFADFARDRQSLFDVFPTMSQDTYDVLVHSLALDPANRSLAAVKEALKTAVSFTTDDESLDEFCTEQTDLVTIATAAREPLRTPSITSPNMGGDSFPWTTALLKSPQKAGRQLSTIRDEDHDLFPGSVKDEWHYVDTDEASLSSNVDSGLGMSYKSAKSVESTKSTGTFGSLPINFMRPTAQTSSPYRASADGFSKSWSDLWDEDEEMDEVARSSFEYGMEIDRASTAKPSTPQLRTISESERGSVTPRQVLAETDANSRAASPFKRMFESDKEKVSLPKTCSSSLLDKWSALGNFRRARGEPATPVASVPTPLKTKYAEAFSNFTPFSSNKKPKESPAPLPSWRQDSPPALAVTAPSKSQIWDRKESPTHAPQQWELDDNWRAHRPQATRSSPTTAQPIRTNPFFSSPERKRDSSPSVNEPDLTTDDLDADMEWVFGPAGKMDLHL